jgi:hypothetical protein
MNDVRVAVASTTTVDQMNRIVSELPVFTAASPLPIRSRRAIPAVEPDRPLRGPMADAERTSG